MVSDVLVPDADDRLHRVEQCTGRSGLLGGVGGRDAAVHHEVAPVTKDDSSDARKSAALAISSAWPNRPGGM